MAKGETSCAAFPFPAEGESHVAVASRLGISKMTVGKWRRRYLERGIEGLQDEERPGRPRTHDDERVAEVINTALHSKPPQGQERRFRRF